jgi:hypothetical protein
MQKTPKRRRHPLRTILGALVLTALIAAAVVFFPRGLRGPETVAGAFVETLMQAPDDMAKLRAAGHLAEDADPLARIGDLPTRIALDFLHARERQGAGHALRVTERRRPAPQRYALTLEVSERGDAEAPARRFALALQQADDGDWRVESIRAVD